MTLLFSVLTLYMGVSIIGALYGALQGALCGFFNLGGHTPFDTTAKRLLPSYGASYCVFERLFK